MMNAIQTEGLTKFYGRSRGIIDLDLEGTGGRILWLYPLERSRKKHDHPDPDGADT